MAKMKGDKPNYFQGHRICMDQNNSLQLNKSQLNSFTKKLEHRRLTNIARQIEYFLEIFLCSFDNRAPRKQQRLISRMKNHCLTLMTCSLQSSKSLN